MRSGGEEGKIVGEENPRKSWGDCNGGSSEGEEEQEEGHLLRDLEVLSGSQRTGRSKEPRKKKKKNTMRDF